MRVRQIKRGANVLSYEPGRFLTTERGGQKVTHRLDETGRVRVTK